MAATLDHVTASVLSRETLSANRVIRPGHTSPAVSLSVASRWRERLQDAVLRFAPQTMVFFSSFKLIDCAEFPVLLSKLIEVATAAVDVRGCRCGTELIR